MDSFDVVVKTLEPVVDDLELVDGLFDLDGGYVKEGGFNVVVEVLEPLVKATDDVLILVLVIERTDEVLVFFEPEEAVTVMSPCAPSSGVLD